MAFLTYVSLLTLVAHVSVYGQGYNNAFNLRSDMLIGYDKTIRPLLNQVDLMYVNITYDFGGIQEINEVEGTMTVLMQFTYTWIDERIRWSPNDYNNTNSLLLPIDSVWKPELIAVSQSDISLDSSVTNVRYFPNGQAYLWNPLSVISTVCIINIEFYPFDTQKCPIWFLLMDYFSTEVQLHAVNTEAPLLYYLPNGIWELVKTEANADGLVLYAINLTVARKPTFVIIIVIIPIMMLSLMSIMVFLLPPESGERMSYSITLLLALMVFLTIVSDNIPKTSSPISKLLYFIGLHVLLSVFVTLATILNLRLYYKDDQEPVPAWLCYCCRKRAIGQQYTNDGYKGQSRRPAQSLDPILANRTTHRTKVFVPNGSHDSVFRIQSHGGYVDGNNWQFHKILDDDQPRLKAAEKAKTKLTWKDISRIADWIMFSISILYFVVVFVVFALLAVFMN